MHAQLVDGSIWKHDEEGLKHFQDQNLDGFLVSLYRELANEKKHVDSYKLVGLILKNALDENKQHIKF